MIALLTGVPGVGKSSLARRISERNEDVVRTVSFGDLLRVSVERRLGASLDHATFRASAASLVSPADINDVNRQIASRPWSSDTDRWILIDSHAVARERHGWHANPDSPETLRQYGYGCVILLDAPPNVILRRIRRSRGGRLIEGRRDISVLTALQRSIAIFYSGTLGCPMWVIDAKPHLDQVADAVELALRMREPDH